MKNRLSPLLAIAVLVMLAASLAGCEKDRPVPTALGTGTPAAGQRGPQASATKVALPVTSGGTDAQAAPTTGSTAATEAPAAQNTGVAGQSASGADQSFLYTVVKGDTLAKIAKKYNVTAESIVTLNDLANPNVIAVGKQLKIPGQQSGGTGGSNTYTVKSGETLYSIASRFNVSITDLQKLNNITDANQVNVGQVLKLPEASSSGSAASTSGNKTYTVQRGDTLYSIAVRNGVTTAALQSANNITDPNQIKVGQVLTIP